MNGKVLAWIISITVMVALGAVTGSFLLIILAPFVALYAQHRVTLRRRRALQADANRAAIARDQS